MTKFSFKFKKPYFWPISPILWGKKRFLKKYGTHNLITFSSTNIQRNLMIQFQENNQRHSRKEGQILYHKALPATARGPTSTTAADWHLKDDIEDDKRR